VTSEPLTPEAERQALEELVQSDGWHILMAHMDEAWGPEACEAALRDAKKNATPEEWPFETTRILDAFAAMRANVRWPQERIRALKDGAPARVLKARIMDPFQKFRRGVGAR
jgi:hypothetical protein